MLKGSNVKDWFSHMIAAFLGGVLCLISSQFLQSNVLSIKELRILGPSGKEQIRLCVENTGPVVRLSDKDDSQEIRLEVIDSPTRKLDAAPPGTKPMPLDNSFRRSQLRFINQKNKHTDCSLSTSYIGWSNLTCGSSDEPWFVNLSSYPSTEHPSANLSLGAIFGQHFNVEASDRRVKADLGGLDCQLKLIDKIQSEPTLTIEPAGGVVKRAVFQ